MLNNNIDIKQVIEQETGQKFNRYNKICCPFHKEKTPSLSIKDNRFCCFGCGVSGDAIDFIKQFKGFDYVNSIKYLGIASDSLRNESEKNLDSIKHYCNWLIEHHDRIKDKNFFLETIYQFKDENNKVAYYKAKFRSTEGKKEIFYLSIDETGKVVLKRLGKEIPYDYFNLMKGLIQNKPIFIVEGEKDSETLKSFGYIVTSFKGVKDFDYSIFINKNVYIIGDTGEAGKKYILNMWKELKGYVNQFNLVELKDLKLLGDNKDITDWFNAGYTHSDFKNSLTLVWDFKKSTEWRFVEEDFQKGEFKGYKPKKLWENLECLLNRYKIDLKLNDLNRRIEQNYSPTENTFYEDIYTLCRMNDFKLTIDEVHRFCLRIAENNKESIVKNYLNEALKEYDGKDYLTHFYSTIRVKEGFKEDIKNMYLLKMLLNSIHIAFNSEDLARNAEGLIVLQGKQGIGKTRWVKRLSPFEKTIKTGEMINVDSKDKIFEITGYWYTEIGELESTLKGDIAKLKAFITESIDELRRPYQRASERFPRKTTFIGTVNSEDFLKDETGNRRYWVIPVEFIDNDLFDKLNLKQLYGQIMTIYKNQTEVHYFTQEQLEILNDQNKQFIYKNSIQLTLEDYMSVTAEGEYNIFTVTDLANGILKGENKKSISNTLKLMGYENKPHRINGVVKRGFKLPIRKSPFEITIDKF